MTLVFHIYIGRIYRVEVSIPACHTGGWGSIPRRKHLFFGKTVYCVDGKLREFFFLFSQTLRANLAKISNTSIPHNLILSNQFYLLALLQ